ncbi:MAG: nucleotidyltransferase domain-containing protein [Ruminococcus sp.]|nr:nucleotidyltransferase domain-containing protein [Ruminococcus sp.]
MKNINNKIINSIISRAEMICPDSLALIGVYGSVATGDIYKKSDLDLLILINDDVGYRLATGFILDDSKIGYDLYCTTLDNLKYDSECHNAHLSKLMESEIVYVKNQQAYDELYCLREKTKSFLSSDERFARVRELIEKAMLSFADACLYDNIGKVRINVCDIILSLANAIMIYHGTYFKRGIKRIFDELSQFPLDSIFLDNMRKISQSKDVNEMRLLAKENILYVKNYTSSIIEKAPPSKENITGTYEEMYSNWRNKVGEAAERNDVFSSFLNMCLLQHMIADISSEIEIGNYDLMENFEADYISDNTKAFDYFLAEYEKMYQSCGLYVKHYSNIDEFVKDYTNH